MYTTKNGLLENSINDKTGDAQKVHKQFICHT